MKIARRFTGADRDKYQKAADDVRLPYWDWASEKTQSRIPASMKQSSISVIKPGTGSTTIPNPLYSYRFLNAQDSSSGLGASTVRGPNDDALVESFPSREQETLDLFSDEEYNTFSSNLEGIHDTVHAFVGGDMGFVDRAAFDPLFWLHHCNVDRLMAMFQAAKPGLTVTPAPRSPTFALGGPGPDDINTPLYPFRHPDAREWTSTDVSTAESIFTYGYAYPEVPSGRSGSDLQAHAIEQARKLYGPDTSGPSFQGNDSGVPQSKQSSACSMTACADESTSPDSSQGMECQGAVRYFRPRQSASDPYLHRSVRRERPIKLRPGGGPCGRSRRVFWPKHVDVRIRRPQHHRPPHPIARGEKRGPHARVHRAEARGRAPLGGSQSHRVRLRDRSGRGHQVAEDLRHLQRGRLPRRPEPAADQIGFQDLRRPDRRQGRWIPAGRAPACRRAPGRTPGPEWNPALERREERGRRFCETEEGGFGLEWEVVERKIRPSRRQGRLMGSKARKETENSMFAKFDFVNFNSTVWNVLWRGRTIFVLVCCSVLRTSSYIAHLQSISLTDPVVWIICD